MKQFPASRYLDCLRYLIRQPIRHRSPPAGIFKNMHLGKGNLPQKLLRLGEFFLTLPRKSHDHIRGERRPVKMLPQQNTFFAIFLWGVMPVHAHQCRLTSALQREMKVRTKGVKVPQRPDKGFCYDSRFQGTQANSGNPGNDIQFRKQIQQRVCLSLFLSIGRQVNPRQYDFPVPSPGKFLYLPHHRLRIPAADSAPCIGDDTVRAELAAAVLDLDESPRPLPGIHNGKGFIFRSDFF